MPWRPWGEEVQNPVAGGVRDDPELGGGEACLAGGGLIWRRIHGSSTGERRQQHCRSSTFGTKPME